MIFPSLSLRVYYPTKTLYQTFFKDQNHNFFKLNTYNLSTGLLVNAFSTFVPGRPKYIGNFEMMVLLNGGQSPLIAKTTQQTDQQNKNSTLQEECMVYITRGIEIIM